MRKSGLASLVFFYYDYRDGRGNDLRGLLSSLLVQVCNQSDSYYEVLSTFYSTLRCGALRPSDGELVRCLKDLLRLPGQAPVYLLVDALDECLNININIGLLPPLKITLELLEELMDVRFPNLRICVSSRPTADIKLVLEPLAFRSISLHDESGQTEDIQNFINSVVNTNRNIQRWELEHMQLVIDTLTRRADGM
jgi:hypothetical protein